MRGCETYLVYHINKGLRIVPNEGTDCVTCIVAREDGLDQGGDLMQSECTCCQTFTGWELKLKKKNQGQSAFHARRQMLDSRRTALRYRGRGSVNGLQVPAPHPTIRLRFRQPLPGQRER